jgi:hypothetical protein
MTFGSQTLARKGSVSDSDCARDGYRISDAPPDHRWNRSSGPYARPLAEAAGHDLRTPARAELDLFAAAGVVAAIRDAHAVLHLATRIRPLDHFQPPEEWRENDRLRAEASAILVGAALAAAAAVYVQPTVTFVYPGDRAVSEETRSGTCLRSCARL